MPHKEDIKAVVWKAGKTLTSIALAAGLHESTCRQALQRHSPAGEKAIAEALDTTPETLWPDRYPKSGGDPTKNQHRRARQKAELELT